MINLAVSFDRMLKLVGNGIMIKEEAMMAQGNKVVGAAKGPLRSCGTLAIDLSGIDQSRSIAELVEACKGYGQQLDARDISYIFGQSRDN